MPVILGLIAGGLGGYGTYVGWLEGLGLTSGSIGVAVTVGIILFLLSAVLGLFVIVIGDM